MKTKRIDYERRECLNVSGHLFLLLCLLTFLQGSVLAQAPADLVIINAKVVTIDRAKPRGNAIAMTGEWIVQVGTNDEVRPYIKEGETKVIDARSRLVVPGFNDAHVHVIQGGYSLLNLNFRNITDVKIIQRMVKERVAQVKPGDLIRGRCWDHELFGDKKWPRRQMLDEVAPDNPVVLSRVDGHSVWVNSLVLEKSNITAETPDPAGGTIVRDARTGEPTGILKESAQGLIKVKDTLSADGRLERDCEALDRALALARRKGVTSMQDMTWSDLRSLERIKGEGRLTARITFGKSLTDDTKRLQFYNELRTKCPATNNWTRFGILKGFMDGTLGSGTALMFEPFADDPSTSGLPQMSYETLKRRVLAADKLGFQIGIHAIGTKANHWILNAFDEAGRINGRRDRRFRSEHAQILADGDIPRFGRSGVIASMQPTHCITDKRFAEKRIGRRRCRGAYAWKRLLDANARIAFGTDWPVEPLDPLEGLYAAVTRKDRAGEPGDGWFPDQKLSVEKAIELYTIGSAYAEFMEGRKGRIKKGYLADVVIFDRDLLGIPSDQIMAARVDYTIVGGKVVYKR
jgi:predicted amidohydrolase YtcJ